jgi:hypothetical protein
MTSKRLRRDTGAQDLPTDTPDTPEAAVAAIRRLMRQFSVDPAMLEDDDLGLSLSLSWGLVC